MVNILLRIFFKLFCKLVHTFMDNNINKNIPDLDPQETQEWIESIESLIKSSGSNRAHFILNHLISFARRNGVRMPFQANTDYVNTIPLEKQQPYKGDRSIERRIKSIIRWNAMAMVVRANRKNHGIGGHISSFASSTSCLPLRVTPPGI